MTLIVFGSLFFLVHGAITPVPPSYIITAGHHHWIHNAKPP
jgi:hypothetical protein